MAQQYKIVEGGTIAILEEAVNKLLECGWKLHGGIVISTFNGLKFYQAITKEYEQPGAWG